MSRIYLQIAPPPPPHFGLDGGLLRPPSLRLSVANAKLANKIAASQACMAIYILRNQTDARDIKGIWVAAQQLHICGVALKIVSQQTCLCLHYMCAQLMKMPVMQTNVLRILLYEFGIALPEVNQVLLARIPTALAKASELLPRLF